MASRASAWQVCKPPICLHLDTRRLPAGRPSTLMQTLNLAYTLTHRTLQGHLAAPAGQRRRRADDAAAAAGGGRGRRHRGHERDVPAGHGARAPHGAGRAEDQPVPRHLGLHAPDRKAGAPLAHLSSLALFQGKVVEAGRLYVVSSVDFPSRTHSCRQGAQQKQEADSVDSSAASRSAEQRPQCCVTSECFIHGAQVGVGAAVYHSLITILKFWV